MTTDVTQRFPRAGPRGIEHHVWSVDFSAARRWVPTMGDDRLRSEAAEMAAHFPRWVLTVARHNQTLACSSCGGLLVFERGLRCVACGQTPPTPGHDTRLSWFGVMPPIGIDGLKRLRKRLLKNPPARHVVAHATAIGHYLLVPLLATYPVSFPQDPVQITYLPELFSLPGVPPPRPSHEVHLLDRGRMCLFVPGQWVETLTCREVLEQRAYAHVIKLLNFANGKRTAFAKVS